MDPAVVSLEAAKLAVGLAKDLSVQLLTLGSALIGLTVALSKDIKNVPSRAESFFVTFTLIVYFVSLMAGVYTLMKMIGILAPVGGPGVISLEEARTGALVQIVAFSVGTVLLILYGIFAVRRLRA